jgi:hypothetical protein
MRITNKCKTCGKFEVPAEHKHLVKAGQAEQVCRCVPKDSLRFPLDICLWVLMVFGRTMLLVVLFAWFQMFMGARPDSDLETKWILVMALIGAIVVQRFLFKKKLA